MSSSNDGVESKKDHVVVPLPDPQTKARFVALSSFTMHTTPAALRHFAAAGTAEPVAFSKPQSITVSITPESDDTPTAVTNYFPATMTAVTYDSESKQYETSDGEPHRLENAASSWTSKPELVSSGETGVVDVSIDSETTISADADRSTAYVYTPPLTFQELWKVVGVLTWSGLPGFYMELGANMKVEMGGWGSGSVEVQVTEELANALGIQRYIKSKVPGPYTRNLDPMAVGQVLVDPLDAIEPVDALSATTLLRLSFNNNLTINYDSLSIPPGDWTVDTLCAYLSSSNVTFSVVTIDSSQFVRIKSERGIPISITFSSEPIRAFLGFGRSGTVLSGGVQYTGDRPVSTGRAKLPVVARLVGSRLALSVPDTPAFFGSVASGVMSTSQRSNFSLPVQHGFVAGDVLDVNVTQTEGEESKEYHFACVVGDDPDTTSFTIHGLPEAYWTGTIEVSRRWGRELAARAILLPQSSDRFIALGPYIGATDPMVVLDREVLMPSPTALGKLARSISIDLMASGKRGTGMLLGDKPVSGTARDKPDRRNMVTSLAIPADGVAGVAWELAATVFREETSPVTLEHLTLRLWDEHGMQVDPASIGWTMTLIVV